MKCHIEEYLMEWVNIHDKKQIDFLSQHVEIFT